MASYTMTLGTYIEGQSQYKENLSTKDKIEIGRTKLFDFDYPIFDESYRKIFETNIIRKFYMREIGFETEGLFKFYLENFLTVNMPYFNRLFESEMLKYDPLVNSEMNVTHTQNKQKDEGVDRDTTQHVTGNNKQFGSGENTAEGSATKALTGKDTSTGERVNDDFNRKVSSDTPDSRLQLQTQEGKGVIEYASNIDEVKTNDKEVTKSGKDTSETSKGTTSNKDQGKFENETNVLNDVLTNDNISTQVNEIEDFIQHRQGKTGAISYSDLVMKYRKSFLRIENMIHNEIQDLFMLVY